MCIHVYTDEVQVKYEWYQGDISFISNMNHEDQNELIRIPIDRLVEIMGLFKIPGIDMSGLLLLKTLND